MICCIKRNLKIASLKLKFNRDGKIIKNKSTIAEELNNSIINIGPNKVGKKWQTKKLNTVVNTYEIIMTLSDTIAIINSIKAKKSCSHDQ